jgi:hypothetical protein
MGPTPPPPTPTSLAAAGGGHRLLHYTTPFTLSGTTINDISTDMLSMAQRTHCAANKKYMSMELWYWRNEVWNYDPVFQPVTDVGAEPKLNIVYQQPATLEFVIPDSDGIFYPENRNSSMNYNSSGVWDPILDIARKIVLRYGITIYTDILSGLSANANNSPSVGTVSRLTNGILTDFSSVTDNTVHWNNAGVTTLDFDLGSSQFIQHTVIRFGTKTQSTFQLYLPNSVTIYWSANGTDWTQGPTRPIGGNGTSTLAPGDWADSYYGIGVEISFCDLEIPTRYIRFAINNQSGHTFAVDEIAVYGGHTGAVYGKNMFMGYLGDTITLPNDGQIAISATGIEKKAKDNNETFRLTPPYYQEDAADILYSILTSGVYWRNLNEYSTAFTSGEVGWSSGVKFTGLTYPLWQGQSNSTLGYIMELAHSLGWMILGDGNGIWQLTQPVFSQRAPDQVISAGNSSNDTGRLFVRNRTDQSMRNTVEVSSGKATDGSPGTNVFQEPNSVRRWGPRRTGITDPILQSTTLRDKVGEYFLREYAWRTQTLEGNFNPDFDTRLKQIMGFRAPARPALFARSSTKSGDLREVELWALTKATHKLGIGEWCVDVEAIPYFPFITDAPSYTSFTSASGIATLISSWTPPSDPLVVSVRLYISPTSDISGFEEVAEYPIGTNSASFTATYNVILADGTTVARPINLAQRYYSYVSSIDVEGNESLPSVTLSVIAGSNVAVGSDCGAYGSGSGYVINDYVVNVVGPPLGPDASGHYTYQFFATWTAPLCGHTQHRTRINPFTLPTGDIDKVDGVWAWGNSKWDWWAPDRIPQGKMWDYTTPGQLDFTYTLKSDHLFVTGERIYFRIWNSTRTRAWIPVPSNYTYVEF